MQELLQKKYVEAPVYRFDDRLKPTDEWSCTCICNGIVCSGRTKGKTEAKKKAAYGMIVWLLKAAGICKDEWLRDMLEW